MIWKATRAYLHSDISDPTCIAIRYVPNTFIGLTFYYINIFVNCIRIQILTGSLAFIHFGHVSTELRLMIAPRADGLKTIKGLPVKDITPQVNKQGKNKNASNFPIVSRSFCTRWQLEQLLTPLPLAQYDTDVTTFSPQGRVF